MAKKVSSPKANKKTPLAGVIMGSKSDWETLERASQTLEALGIPHECR
ncbi:MAG: 5-(carboxyamino)imidazole ribonucleotide mutase, partial [Chthoniobacterales bacterium]